MYRPKLKVREVTPTSMRKTTAFVTEASGCSVKEIELPVYPMSPEGVRFASLRKRLGLSLREAADRLGLQPVAFSGIEHGRVVLVDWVEGFKRLRGDE
jgi:hypothetical protein